jgi:hypothetical protein
MEQVVEGGGIFSDEPANGGAEAQAIEQKAS